LVRRWALASLLAAAVSAPLLLPAADYLPQTHRNTRITRRNQQILKEPILQGWRTAPERRERYLRIAARLLPIAAPNAYGNNRFGPYWGNDNINEDAAAFGGGAALLAALLATRGTASIRSLEGWARRSPILAIALVGAVAAGLGLPRLDSWGARSSIVRSATHRPLNWIAYFGWLLAYVPVARLLWIGVRSPGDPIPLRARLRLRTPPERPEWPDVRGIAEYVVGSAMLSRLAIASVLTLAIGVGSVVLAFGNPSLSEAAAVLPEPIVPAATASP